MAKVTGEEIHLEAEQADEAPARVKAALFCFGLAAIIVVVGFVWLGRSGMLDPRSPSFVPLPHFFAFASLVLGVFFLVRAFLHGRRYRLFGTSAVDVNLPHLGESLVGTLRIAKPQRLVAPITLRLRCDWRHQTSAPGHVSHDTTTTDHLWEQLVDIAAAETTTGAPFRFDLPEDGLPSGRRPKPTTGVHPESPGYIVWTLRASSPRPGVDYVAEFEVEVRPNRRIGKLARQTRPASAADAAPEADSPMLRGARVVGEAAALLLGGHAPSAEERRAEAEAESRPEPEKPFASSPRPESDGARLWKRVSLVVSAFLLLIGVYSLARQAGFGGQGAEQEATITEVEKNLVTLDLGADDPAHTISVSSFHRWAVGQKVTVLCVPGSDGKRRCRMQSGLDRWLDGAFSLGVALVTFALWSHLRRGRSAW